MAEETPPELVLIEADDAQSQLKDLILRAQSGEEIILTIGGKPAVMLTPPDNIQILSNVGAIYYELPREMGGYAWLGPVGSDDTDSDEASAIR